MAWTIYRLILCLFMAYFAREMIYYTFFDAAISPTIAMWAMFICTLLLFERLYISLVVQHAMRAQRDNEVG